MNLDEKNRKELEYAYVRAEKVSKIKVERERLEVER